jgi:hypothetical protein
MNVLGWAAALYNVGCGILIEELLRLNGGPLQPSFVTSGHHDSWQKDAKQIIFC